MNIISIYFNTLELYLGVFLRDYVKPFNITQQISRKRTNELLSLLVMFIIFEQRPWDFLYKKRRTIMNKNTTNTETSSKVRKMVQIAMLSAVSIILMLFEIPLFFAPSFYKIDLSEVPVLIGAFAMGPIAGVIIELVKIGLHLIMTGSVTAGVGELANFLIGCALVVPSGIIYNRNKTKKGAVIGMTVGTVTMAIIGGLLNAFVLLPTYATAFGMPIEALVDMGSAVNKLITNLTTFVLFAVVPFNLLKGSIVSIIVALIYKKLRPILK